MAASRSVNRQFGIQEGVPNLQLSGTQGDRKSTYHQEYMTPETRPARREGKLDILRVAIFLIRQDIKPALSLSLLFSATLFEEYVVFCSSIKFEL